MLTGRKLPSANVRDEIVSLGENLTISVESKTYSILFWVISTPNSLFEKDWTFGTSQATPRSDVTEPFLKVAEKLVAGLQAQRYAQIYYCVKCGRPKCAEFGFIFLDSSLREANVRVFKEEVYGDCKCRSHIAGEQITDEEIIPRRPK